jgi:hypothetical protein
MISSSVADEVTVEINDESGHTLKMQHVTLSDHSSLDLSNLPNGAYFVRVTPKNGAPIVKRITVQK